jgi:hypothetical protein
MRVVSPPRSTKTASLAGFLAAALLVGSMSTASAIPYSTGGAGPINQLGDTLNTPFDQLTLGAYADDATGLIKLNDVTFVVGINATAPGFASYSVDQGITIAGNPYTISVPFDVAINYSDTLTLPGGVTYWFPGWKLVTEELVIGPVGVGTWTGKFFGTLSAVPLPASLPLFAAGLAGLALLGRLRAKKKSIGLSAI